MTRRIIIQAGSITAEAELIENKTANTIWEALPINSTVNTWGNEVYFAIPVSYASENGQEAVNAGDIAYWPPGKVFCVFFGPTPGRGISQTPGLPEVTNDLVETGESRTLHET